METTLHQGLQRIISVNHDDPAALRSEITHQERIFFNSRTSLKLENPELLAFAVELAIGYGALGRFEDAVALNEAYLPFGWIEGRYDVGDRDFDVLKLGFHVDEFRSPVFQVGGGRERFPYLSY